MEYRIMSQRAKPLKKSPSDEEDGLAYLTRLLELMITDDVKEGRYDAGRLQEAQAAEVIIARELPVISEEHTSAYSKMLKKKAKDGKGGRAIDDFMMELKREQVRAPLLCGYDVKWLQDHA